MAHSDDARISDETLIGRTAAGDLAAFDRLVRRHQAAVYRFARAAAPADGDPEEVLLDTFVAARRAATRFRDEASALPWLLTFARQAIGRGHPRSEREADSTPLSELARAAGWDSARASDALAAGTAERAATEPGVAAALEGLQPGDREVLTLCDRERLTVGEAARVMGLPEAALRTRLHRARLRLLARITTDSRSGDVGAERERLIAGLHCGEVLADLSEHLDGRLSGERSQRIEEHLNGCDGCRRLAGEIIGALRVLRELPEEPLAREIEERLLARLRAPSSPATE